MHPLAQRAMMMMTIIVLQLPHVAQTFYVQHLVLAKSLVTCTLILWPRTIFSRKCHYTEASRCMQEKTLIPSTRV